MPLPSFAVIGAAKSGTTSLFSYLRQHPEIYLPDFQEPSWFAFAGQKLEFTGPDGLIPSVNSGAVTERAVFEALYEPAGPNQVLGDVSPVYLYWPGTPERLAAEVPNARVVAMLRHPVDRAYSAFMHAKRESREPLEDFEAALEAEPARITENCGFLWRYRDLGRYAPQLTRWLDVFPRDHVLVLTYDEFAADPTSVCRRVQGFVGVSTDFEPDTTVTFNPSGIPRSRALYRAIRSQGALARGLRRLAPQGVVERAKVARAELSGRLLKRVPMDSEVRARLVSEWRDDILAVADVVEIDVANWLEPEPSPAG